MRATRFHRLLHGLALVATLALVAMPPLGRVFGSGASAHHAVPTPEMAQGHHAHHAMVASGHAVPEAPQPHQHPRDGDCDYCPLLQSMLGSVAPSLLPTEHLAPIAPQTVFRSAAPVFRNPTGLGSRGPPNLS